MWLFFLAEKAYVLSAELWLVFLAPALDGGPAAPKSTLGSKTGALKKNMFVAEPTEAFFGPPYGVEPRPRSWRQRMQPVHAVVFGRRTWN